MSEPTKFFAGTPDDRKSRPRISSSEKDVMLTDIPARCPKCWTQQTLEIRA